MKFRVKLALLGLMAAMSLPCRAWDEAQVIALARDAVRCEVMATVPPAPQESDAAAPVFVTIERRGQVIGCRGTLRARESSLQREVMRAARAAAQHDPRYAPLSRADLKDFLVTVTVVESQIPISLAEVDSLRPEDGLVLQSGAKFGIVLPWEGKDPRVRLGWAYRKAGVARGASCRLFRLKAQRFRG